MNLGYPGTFSRNGDCIIAARLVKSTDTNNVYFGDAVFLNGDSTGGTFSDAVQIGGSITMAAFAGIAVREVKSNETFLPVPTLGFYAPGAPCDVLERGAVIVPYHAFSANPAPVAGGKVYLRIATNGVGTAVGQFESAADGGNTIQLTNAFFTTGLLDANNNVEITLVGRNLP
jgi:hypothetical protein